MSNPVAKRIRAAALITALLLVILASTALAQDYSFNLSENRVDLYINGDGTIQIIYDLTFANDSGAHPIDVVDVGMPNDTYNLSEIRA
jgi:hypothetical protein